MSTGDKVIGRGTVKHQLSNSKVEDKRDITTYFLILHIMYRTVVLSHAGNKIDVRYGNTLKIVINLCTSCLIYRRHWNLQQHGFVKYLSYLSNWWRVHSKDEQFKWSKVVIKYISSARLLSSTYIIKRFNLYCNSCQQIKKGKALNITCNVNFYTQDCQR